MRAGWHLVVAHFEEGTKHTKVFRMGRFTLLPRHGGKELPTGTVEGIKKALGLK
jgi:hypothetical protein